MAQNFVYHTVGGQSAVFKNAQTVWLALGDVPPMVAAWCVVFKNASRIGRMGLYFVGNIDPLRCPPCPRAHTKGGRQILWCVHPRA